MLRLFIIISLLTTFILAKEVKFNETKYINALDIELSKKGTIIFADEFTILSYTNENNLYKFLKDHILKVENKKETILQYDNNLELTIFNTLLNAIYKNNFEQIKQYFTIKKENKIIVLNPNDYISNVIDKIEYKKTLEKLEFLEIYFTNEDRIKIVETK